MNPDSTCVLPFFFNATSGFEGGRRRIPLWGEDADRW